METLVPRIALGVVLTNALIVLVTILAFSPNGFLG
jgi:hypothetical protein